MTTFRMMSNGTLLLCYDQKKALLWDLWTGEKKIYHTKIKDYITAHPFLILGYKKCYYVEMKKKTLWKPSQIEKIHLSCFSFPLLNKVLFLPLFSEIESRMAFFIREASSLEDMEMTDTTLLIITEHLIKGTSLFLVEETSTESVSEGSTPSWHWYTLISCQEENTAVFIYFL